MPTAMSVIGIDCNELCYFYPPVFLADRRSACIHEFEKGGFFPLFLLFYPPCFMYEERPRIRSMGIMIRARLLAKSETN
jgi:hypothetical protein